MSERLQTIDRETKLVLTTGAKIRDLVNSDGWAEAKRMLHERLVDIGNIMTIERGDDMMKEVGARQMVLEIILGWIADVEGTASQNKNNVDRMKEVMGQSHIYRMPESEE